jgi:hypothetical protein
MNCKEYGRKLFCVALRYYYSTFLEKHENLVDL